MTRYVIAIAGNSDPAESGPALPRDVSITFVPEMSWPIWHTVFGLPDLTGLWWYAAAADARPVLTAALDEFDERGDELARLLDPQDWRGVRGNRQVLARVIEELDRWPDNVIAVGREDE
ncbi:hypothetical protein [Skermania piniformis]|uniref:Uncharacterized protein n=1 Tax=Skermania pinensis TaxID=39122 RepID=A0ABX8SAD9_9ACTN|nr:hypothetical protein [Skermania piniformis]QXQ14829.1 hypothetical protein KV203_05460 [Skermania piniformis]